MSELIRREDVLDLFKSLDAETLACLRRIAERAAPIETFDSGHEVKFAPYSKLKVVEMEETE